MMFQAGAGGWGLCDGESDLNREVHSDCEELCTIYDLTSISMEVE